MKMSSLSLGGLSVFNIQHGYVEAIVRGFRSSFLKDSDYHHLTQCESLEDVRLNLAETDYGSYIANDVSITPGVLQKRALAKLVSEFQYIQAQASEPLTTFLQYIQVEYMIENTMLLLRGTLSGRNVNEILDQCHPLGLFDENTMKNIVSFEASPRGYAELYESVLVDTPVGKYFEKYLEESRTMFGSASEMKNILDEIDIEVLKNTLMKHYLLDFHTYCSKLDGESSEMMCELLSSRSDRDTINLTLNSFNTPLNDVLVRSRLYPTIGHLYPAGTDLISKSMDEQKLLDSLKSYNE